MPGEPGAANGLPEARRSKRIWLVWALGVLGFALCGASMLLPFMELGVGTVSCGVPGWFFAGVAHEMIDSWHPVADVALAVSFYALASAVVLSPLLARSGGIRRALLWVLPVFLTSFVVSGCRQASVGFLAFAAGAAVHYAALWIYHRHRKAAAGSGRPEARDVR